MFSPFHVIDGFVERPPRVLWPAAIVVATEKELNKRRTKKNNVYSISVKWRYHVDLKYKKYIQGSRLKKNFFYLSLSGSRKGTF